MIVSLVYLELNIAMTSLYLNGYNSVNVFPTLFDMIIAIPSALLSFGTECIILCPDLSFIIPYPDHLASLNLSQ